MRRWMLHDRDGDWVADYESHDGDQVRPGDVVVTSDGRRWRVVQAVPVETLSEFVDRPKVGALVVEPG